MALIEKLENIGNAIRTKTGKTDLLTLDEMVTEIGNIETGGGGGDVSEYLPSTVPAGGISSTYHYYHYYIKKIPKFDISIDVYGLSTNIGGLFYGYKSLEDIDLSGLNTNGITKMNSMFYNCASLTSLDLSGFDTSSVNHMGELFYNCGNLTSLDLNNFDFSSVNRLNNMFYGCRKLTNLIFGNNLGKGYTQQTANYSNYRLLLNSTTLITHDSLMNVINKLYDLNSTYDVANGGTLYTQTLQLGSTNLAKLTADEIAIATNKGWTVS